jgi:outer membrane protein OmpA-like peptidoglycan-associated protein
MVPVSDHLTMHRSPFAYAVLILSAVLAAAALGLLALRWGVLSRRPAPAPVPPPTETRSEPTPEPTAIAELQKPLPTETAAETFQDLGLAEAVPETLVTNIAKALDAGDFDHVVRLVGKTACSEQTLAQLKALATAHPLKVRQPNGIREIGELELNALSRWSLALDGAEPGRDKIYLDLRQKNGKWSVESLALPTAPGTDAPRAVLADPLGTADAFLQAVLKQDFDFACDFIDPQTVTDAKIAALCILFEEGGYELRHAKPLRAMFRRADTVGYLAHVQTADASQPAQFTLTLRQPSASANWIIAEINLDELLADYARRVAGGDIHYSPLVKNPRGGDTLALYFEFDEDQMNPRTQRQLEIVSQILRADPGKKITLSGHTDALGTVDYNNQLSSRRAATVRDFLANSGVAASQIVTIAKGASQPRRPNVTETGKDDPVGRRANRRTEIYLDF